MAAIQFASKNIRSHVLIDPDKIDLSNGVKITAKIKQTCFDIVEVNKETTSVSIPNELSRPESPATRWFKESSMSSRGKGNVPKITNLLDDNVDKMEIAEGLAISACQNIIMANRRDNTMKIVQLQRSKATNQSERRRTAFE